MVVILRLTALPPAYVLRANLTMATLPPRASVFVTPPLILSVATFVFTSVLFHWINRLDERQYEKDSSDEANAALACSKAEQAVVIAPEQQRRSRTTLEDEMKNSGGVLTVQPIGFVRSVYRLCVGTPRQGGLAPHARGRIELTLDEDGRGDADAAIDGLEQYSHIWIVFIFHLNTQNSKGQRVTPSKIAPPALGGRKVGTLASRSPHRFNPIGITLAKLERIERRRDQKKISGNSSVLTSTCLHISGLDLVDGTPVLDIKPYVPTYDAPPSAPALAEDACRVPPWVAEGLQTQRTVIISRQAQDELTMILEQNIDALEFYGRKNNGETIPQALSNMLACIQEVLAIDVRSQWQTSKARLGKSQAERANRLQTVRGSEIDKAISTVEETTSTMKPVSSSSDSCTQQIDNLLVYYVVEEAEQVTRSSSLGSGAEDVVTVTSIHLLHPTNDLTTNQSS